MDHGDLGALLALLRLQRGFLLFSHVHARVRPSLLLPWGPIHQAPEDRRRIIELHAEGVSEDELVAMVIQGEDKYKDLEGNIEREGNSLGHHFLEKIFQLSTRLPNGMGNSTPILIDHFLKIKQPVPKMVPNVNEGGYEKFIHFVL